MTVLCACHASQVFAIVWYGCLYLISCIKQLVEEKRALEDAEKRASEEYIQRLLAEEEEPLVEARRRQEEKQLEDDERLARLISQELVRSHITDGLILEFGLLDAIQRSVMHM